MEYRDVDDAEGIRSDLDQYGYCIVSGVLTEEECAASRICIEEWAANLYEDGRSPKENFSIVSLYGVAHLEAVWKARLRAKKVFRHVWETDKLLCSLDGIALAGPVEEEESPKYAPDDEEEEIISSWLHTDQNWGRVGRHAIQGAVYVEEVAHDDWTLCLLKGSHKHFSEVFKDPQMREGNTADYYPLDKAAKQLYMSLGCEYTRVSVPKGGMVLWDSRTIHANARSKQNRKHPGRWRMLSFVSMQPAVWATESDYAKKKEAYEEKATTTHWASTFICKITPRQIPGTKNINQHPDIARTDEALELMGIKRYDFNDGKPNGPPLPETRQEYLENIPSDRDEF